MTRAKAQARPKRTKQTASKQLQALKDGIASAVKQLNDAREDLAEVDAFVFVCIQALRGKGGDNVDVDPVVATVLEAAYDKLALDLHQNLRDALEALVQDGGK